MAKRSSLRASDADRDHVAERLRQATAEGRLLAQELEERLATALRARTYGELDSVVADLPGSPVSGGQSRSRPRSRTRELISHQPALIVGVMVAFALVAVILAVVAFVASGAWVAFLVLGLIIRGRRPGDRRGRDHRHLHGDQVHVHVHHRMR
jgi:hypothetical protein